MRLCSLHTSLHSRELKLVYNSIITYYGDLWCQKLPYFLSIKLGTTNILQVGLPGHGVLIHFYLCWRAENCYKTPSFYKILTHHIKKTPVLQKSRWRPLAPSKYGISDLVFLATSIHARELKFSIKLNNQFRLWSMMSWMTPCQSIQSGTIHILQVGLWGKVVLDTLLFMLESWIQHKTQRSHIILTHNYTKQEPNRPPYHGRRPPALHWS